MKTKAQGANNGTTLTGLPGTDGTAKATEFFKNVTAGVSALRRGLTATAAGDCGAINLWRDDAGKFRCEFYVRLTTRESTEFERLGQVVVWLQRWLPEIHGGAA